MSDSLQVRNATGFVHAVENNLGWAAEETSDKPLWKIRAIEAFKVNRKVATDPNLYTWANAVSALQYCRRNKIKVKSPASVLWYVEKALAEVPSTRPAQVARPLREIVDDAIAFELGLQDDESEVWIERFTRAQGPGLVSLYRDWAKHRGIT